MASRRLRRTTRRIGLLGALAGLLLGCSSGSSKKHEAPGIPDPASGKVAAFELNALSSRFDLDHAVSDIPALSHIASDRAGNAYVMDSGGRQPIEIFRLTPKGTVSRFASIETTSTTLGLAAMQGGALAVGRDGGLLRVDEHGSTTTLRTGHNFGHPDPIGARPDGSLVVLDAGQVWAVKDGHTTALTGKQSRTGSDGTVDDAGTTYALLDDKTTIGDMTVIPPADAPRALHVSGRVPGSSQPISGLKVLTIARAAVAGFYAVTENEGETASYLVHVQGTSAQVLARTSIGGGSSAGCVAGKQYPALGNPCVTPWFAVPLGSRVLLVGDSDDTTSTPALAVASAATPST